MTLDKNNNEVDSKTLKPVKTKKGFKYSNWFAIGLLVACLALLVIAGVKFTSDYVGEYLYNSLVF